MVLHTGGLLPLVAKEGDAADILRKRACWTNRRNVGSERHGSGVGCGMRCRWDQYPIGHKGDTGWATPDGGVFGMLWR